jgi:hypothetical protein
MAIFHPKASNVPVTKLGRAYGVDNLPLQTFSYEDRKIILPALSDAMSRCGCWLLDRRVVSLTQIDFIFEIEQRSILDLYTGLVGAGLELTRASHLALTSLCALTKHASRVAGRLRIVHVQLEVSFLEELDLQSILTPGAARA